MIRDKIGSGWLAWTDGYDAFLAPQPDIHALLPWKEDCQEIVELLRETSMTTRFWEKLSVHYSSENNSEVVSQDNMSSVKSICKFPTIPSIIARYS